MFHPGHAPFSLHEEEEQERRHESEFHEAIPDGLGWLAPGTHLGRKQIFCKPVFTSVGSTHPDHPWAGLFQFETGESSFRADLANAVPFSRGDWFA
jgi:hypothetical protein